MLAIIVSLNDRLREANERGWLGEVDGLKVSLNAANQKLAQMRKSEPSRGQLRCPGPHAATVDWQLRMEHILLGLPKATGNGCEPGR